MQNTHACSSSISLVSSTYQEDGTMGTPQVMEGKEKRDYWVTNPLEMSCPIFLDHAGGYIERLVYILWYGLYFYSEFPFDFVQVLRVIFSDEIYRQA